MNKKCFFQSITHRRSIYNLGNQQITPNDKIIEIISQSLTHCPTAFNSQSGRVAVLFNEQNHKFWNLTKEILKKIIPADKFAPTSDKLDSFSKGLGTILFFEDKDIIQNLQNKFPLYKDNFPKWALQSNGMLEYIIWTSLSENNIGASLQHYNPLVDDMSQQEFGIPENWEMIAQMPFGSIEALSEPKTFLPLNERIKIYK